MSILCRTCWRHWHAAGRGRTDVHYGAQVPPEAFELSAYPVMFTDVEKAQLRAAFVTVVCDYQRPGVGQQRPSETWLDYGSR
jgi:hypothetical protein